MTARLDVIDIFEDIISFELHSDIQFYEFDFIVYAES